jgi:UDPglucose 6-dehydrogenase
LGGLRGKRIALLGLAFKGGTDDVRESRAIPLARALLKRGAHVIAYDPVANTKFRREVCGIAFARKAEAALADADGCVVQTDWSEFVDFSAEIFLRLMRTPIVIDGRRILDPRRMDGIRLRRIG